MKIVKILLLFIVIAGGLVLAVNWNSWFDFGGEDANFSSEDLVDIPEQCSNIRSEWERVAAWSDSLYKAQRSDIDQSKEMGMYSMEGYNIVNNALRECALNSSVGDYKKQLHSDMFKHSKVERAYKGVLELAKLEKMEDNSDVKSVKDIHNLYKKIKSFTDSRHYISAKFDTVSTSWKAFSAIENGVLATAKKHRSNKLYQDELTDVPNFKEGLDEANLRSMMDPQKNNFYRKLSEQIVSYYNAKTPTEELVASLDKVYTQFVREAPQNEVTDIARLKVNYVVVNDSIDY